MNFLLLPPVDSHATKKVFLYDEDDDCIISILSDVSDILCESGGKFIISGFGKSQWPVNYGAYLSVFLEELPNAVFCSKLGHSFVINMYEQGVECSIEFEIEDNVYQATCKSRTSWMPNPSIEKIEKEKLYEMLLCFQNDFLKFLKKLSPDLLNHPWIRLLFEHGFEKSMLKEYNLLSA